MIKRKSLGIFIVLVCVVIVFYAKILSAPPLTNDDGPPIILSFDDGRIDQYTNAFSQLKKRGMVGVFYIISDYVGESGYMNAKQLFTLQRCGNEIGSHSKSHINFKELTEDEIINECVLSKKGLEELGLKVTNFRYPYSSSNESIDSIVSLYYNSGCYGSGFMDLPINTWKITVKGSWNCNLTTLKELVDYSYENNELTNINFHRIREGFETKEGNIELNDFIKLLDYVKDKGFRTRTLQQILDGDY